MSDEATKALTDFCRAQYEINKVLVDRLTAIEEGLDRIEKGLHNSIYRPKPVNADAELQAALKASKEASR